MSFGCREALKGGGTRASNPMRSRVGCRVRRGSDQKTRDADQRSAPRGPDSPTVPTPIDGVQPAESRRSAFDPPEYEAVSEWCRTGSQSLGAVRRHPRKGSCWTSRHGFHRREVPAVRPGVEPVRGSTRTNGCTPGMGTHSPERARTAGTSSATGELSPAFLRRAMGRVPQSPPPTRATRGRHRRLQWTIMPSGTRASGPRSTMSPVSSPAPSTRTSLLIPATSFVPRSVATTT